MARSLSEADIAVLSRSVPVVVLAGNSGDDGPDFVGVDNRSGSREITAHLIEVHGHTDLAFLAGPADSPDSGERFEGFCQALRPLQPARKFRQPARIFRRLLGSRCT